MERFTTLGRYFIGFAAFASGFQQLVTGSFVRLVPALPASIPWHTGWVYATGWLLMFAGGAILLGRAARPGAVILGAMLLVMFLVLCLPQALANPFAGFMWTNPVKTLALLGGAILLAAGPEEDQAGAAFAFGRLLGRLRPLGWYLLGVFLLVAGVQHFVYASFVDSLVPAWIPPGPRFWTCLTGVALIAAGVGLALPKTARLAALLSAVMIFLWVLLLHIPRTVALKTLFELDGVFEALAVCGVALLVAAARRPARKGNQ